MSIVREYVKSKGVKHPPKDDLEAILAQLKKEYGCIAPTLATVTQSEVAELPLKTLTYHKAHLQTLKAKKPKGSSTSILGVVTVNNGSLLLVDGHHRLKWALANKFASGTFILLK